MIGHSLLPNYNNLPSGEKKSKTEMGKRRNGALDWEGDPYHRKVAWRATILTMDGNWSKIPKRGKHGLAPRPTSGSWRLCKAVAKVDRFSKAGNSRSDSADWRWKGEDLLFVFSGFEEESLNISVEEETREAIGKMDLVPLGGEER